MTQPMMATVPAAPAGHRPYPTVWVSVEGPNGAGKTHLITALAARLGPEARLLSELTDLDGQTLPAQVIGALAAGASFLRTGHPLTETFALLALKVREHELVTGLPDPPPIVLEDRGVDTVAMYQAAILCGPAADDEQVWRLAQQIYAAAAMWRPAPQLTLLILDDLNVCACRYAEREGHPLTSDEYTLVAQALRLYRRQAEQEPTRFRIVDRTGRDTTDVLAELEHHVHTAAGPHAQGCR